jgi:hypothetical protein
VPEATLDEAALLERIDSAIADGRRLLAELDQLRAVLAARIPAEPEILAAADDDDDDFRPHQLRFCESRPDLVPTPAVRHRYLTVSTSQTSARPRLATASGAEVTE